jgi:hypothetical protein
VGKKGFFHQGVRACACVCVDACRYVRTYVRIMYVCMHICTYVGMYVCIFFIIYTLFTLHAPLLCSNTTCIVVTYIYSSLPFLFIVWLRITLFYL